MNRRLIAPLIAFALLSISPALAQPTHALAMHGAPKYGLDFKHFDYVNPNAPKGGAVKLAAEGSFDSFNGFIIKGEAAVGLGGLYDTLMTSSADEAFSQYGLLAETVETPKDRSWVQFVLRKEARWHDGKPITADDVIWTFETLIEKGEPSYRYYYAEVDRAEKIDERTVRFVFKNNQNRELPLIMGQLVVLPKHYWQGKDFAKTSLEPPLGSGAYKIDKFEAGRFIRYKRVADYWGLNLAVNIGRDNFDTIQYDYYRDSNVMVEALKAGEFDFRNENMSKIWATSYDIPAVKQGLIKKVEVGHNRTSGMQGFVYNTRRDLFKDRLVRQALATAFDYEWSNRNLFYSQYTRSRSYFDNSELAAVGLPGPAELKILAPYRGRIPDEVFSEEYNPPKTNGDGRIRSNLRQGDKLLKEAGWVIRDNIRINEKTGQALEFEIMLVSPAFERIALPFVKNLERLGVKARVRTVDSAQYLKRLETFDFDMLTFAWGQSQSPGNEQLGYWGSAAASQNGSRNLAGVAAPVIDELIAGIIAAPDRESLIAQTRALDRNLQWGFYVIPHWYLNYDRLVFWNKFERPKVTPTGGTQFNTWWINEDAARSTIEGLKSLKGN